MAHEENTCRVRRLPERIRIKTIEAALASMHDSSIYADNSGLALKRLVDNGFADLPLPGSGATLLRWQALAAVAAADPSLVKLFEGHTDALAIRQELNANTVPDATWGVWCAEPPDARLQISARSNDTSHCMLDGRKSWCSGASVLSHALVSGWNEKGEQCLAAVSLDEPGVTITSDGWHAVGMWCTGSVDVIFRQVRAVRVGEPGAYTERPGFWQGGAGIAACWYGAACEIARRLRDGTTTTSDAHRKAHLGAVDVALAGAAAVLRETAAFIDSNPAANAMHAALRARLVVEDAATTVIEHATRALGAGPLCRDKHFARRVADLPVFLRQSHAERDLATLGESVTTFRHTDPWKL